MQLRDPSSEHRGWHPGTANMGEFSRPPSREGVDPQMLIQALGARRWFIALCTVVGLAIVAGFTVRDRMLFQSNARMYLGELDARPGGGGESINLSTGGSGDVASEIEIIRSRSIVSKAIAAAGTNASMHPPGWELPRYFQWRVSGRNFGLLAPDTAGLSIVQAQTKSSKTQRLRLRFGNGGAFKVLVDNTPVHEGMLDLPVQTAVAEFTVRSLPGKLPRAGAEYEVEIRPMEVVVDEVLKQLKITAPRSSPTSTELVKIVSLEFTHSRPAAAAALLRELMTAYLKERQSWKTEEATAAESFVGEQLREMKASLDDTEKRLTDYKTNTKGVVLDQEAQALIEQIRTYEEQRVAARLQVSALNDIKRVLKGPNPPVEAYLFGEARDSALDALGRSLAESRERLAEMNGRFQENAPDVRNLKAQIDAQLASIRNYVDSRLSRAQENLASLNGIVHQFEEKLRTVPGAELGLTQIARESEVYSKLYSYLLQQRQQAAILKASRVSKNRVLDEPNIPLKEASPSLAIRAGAGMIGLLFGVLIVLGSRLFSATVHGESDLRRVHAPARLLANLPSLPQETRAEKKSRDPALPLALRSWAHGPFTEAMRTLRTAVTRESAGASGQVLLISSATPGDGKTTVAAALAAALAEMGSLTLLVDADVRKPSHHDLFAREATRGLAGVLSGNCSWRELCCPVRGDFGEFFSLDAGERREGLPVDKMARFILDVRNRFDFVILDAASFPITADPLALAPLVDTVISVVRCEHTPAKLASLHVEQLASCAHNHGVVLNSSPQAIHQLYGGDYYRHQPRKKGWLAGLRSRRVRTDLGDAAPEGFALRG